MRRVSAGRSALRMTTSWMLVGLLAFGFPGATAIASEPNPAPVAACALSVASDPAGAAVYVNGELRGATPMNLGRLPPGEHRVTVVKDGYLENSRVVTLRPGESGAVQVRMTPGAGKARYTVQQEPGKGGGGGGGKKKLLIALGVVAVGAGVYLALPKNKAPLPGTISTTPSGSGLQGATTFTFSSSATDPDGDPLTFAWNFGDGATGTGASPTHVFATSGAFNVTVTVSDPKNKSAMANTTVTVKSLTGAWGGTLAGVLPIDVTFNQTGSTVTGTWVDRVNGTLNMSGSVGNPRTVQLSLSSSRIRDSISGSLDADVNTFTGQTSGNGLPVRLTRR